VAGGQVLPFRRPPDPFEELVLQMCEEPPEACVLGILLEISGDNSSRILRSGDDTLLLSEMARVMQRLHPQKSYEVRTITLSLLEAADRGLAWRPDDDG